MKDTILVGVSCKNHYGCGGDATSSKDKLCDECRNLERDPAKGSTVAAGSVTSEDIVEIYSQYLTDNPNISLPYSMDIGYWNVLLVNLGIWGFRIIRK